MREGCPEEKGSEALLPQAPTRALRGFSAVPERPSQREPGPSGLSEAAWLCPVWEKADVKASI